MVMVKEHLLQISELLIELKGIIGIVNSKEGNVNSTIVVSNDDEIILSTDKGRVIRCPVKEIRIAGRNTQGLEL